MKDAQIPKENYNLLVSTEIKEFRTQQKQKTFCIQVTILK